MPRRLATRLSIAVVAATLPVLLVAGAASAHVTVNAAGATQGGYAELTFRVPNETDDSATTELRVFFPQDQPLASVSVQPHPGWSFRVLTAKLSQPISSDDGDVTRAVSEVVWKADSPATAIKPGEFDDFNISAGPLPHATSMVFKALQTYDDGTVVRWIQPTTPGADEPEHPAPTLALAPAGDATAATPSGSAAAHDGSGRATAALVLSIVALLLALLAAAAAVAPRFLTRSRS